MFKQIEIQYEINIKLDGVYVKQNRVFMLIAKSLQASKIQTKWIQNRILNNFWIAYNQSNLFGGYSKQLLLIKPIKP